MFLIKFIQVVDKDAHGIIYSMSELFRMMIIGSGICNRCGEKGDVNLSDNEIIMVGINYDCCLSSSIADEFKDLTFEES